MRALPRPCSAGRCGILMLAVLSCALGCVEERVVYDGFNAYRNMEAAGPIRLDDDPAARVAADEGWSILLQEFAGTDQLQRADQLRTRLQREYRVPGLWVRQNGDKTGLYRGLYPRPDTDTARSDLRQTRMLSLDGARPYEDVQMLPLSAAARGASSPLDLRQFPGMRSLQVAVYDSDFGPEFRHAAEDAVNALRKEGHEAYFYHGPNRSMVTIGLFDANDVSRDGDQDGYPPRARELQKLFPYNLVNGRTLLQSVSGQDAKPQPSFLVEVLK